MSVCNKVINVVKLRLLLTMVFGYGQATIEEGKKNPSEPFPIGFGFDQCFLVSFLIIKKLSYQEIKMPHYFSFRHMNKEIIGS